MNIDKYILKINTIVIICLTLVVVLLFFKINELSNAIQINQIDNENEIGRYEFYKANDLNMVVLDTTTGKIWTQFIPSTGGNETWTEDTNLEKEINK